MFKKLSCLGAVALAMMLVPTLAYARAPRLSISLSGTVGGRLAGGPVQAADAGARVTLGVTVAGSVPSGGHVRLAIAPYYHAPFQVQRTAIHLRHSRASLTVTHGTDQTLYYKFVLVSSRGRILAQSRVLTVMWIARPVEFDVYDGLYVSGVELASGALYCEGSPSASCLDADGAGGVSLELSTYTNPGPAPPGSRQSLSFDGQLLCDTAVFNTTCGVYVVTVPQGVANVPVVGTYTSPTGATSTATILEQGIYTS